MTAFRWYLTAFVVAIQIFFAIFVTTKIKLNQTILFWQMLIAFSVLYSYFHIKVINIIGYTKIHDFYKKIEPQIKPNNPFSLVTLAIILFFIFAFFPITLIISYSSAAIIYYNFEFITKFLIKPLPNLALQLLTIAGTLRTIWSFNKNLIQDHIKDR